MRIWRTFGALFLIVLLIAASSSCAKKSVATPQPSSVPADVYSSIGELQANYAFLQTTVKALQEKIGSIDTAAISASLEQVKTELAVVKDRMNALSQGASAAELNQVKTDLVTLNSEVSRIEAAVNTISGIPCCVTIENITRKSIIVRTHTAGDYLIAVTIYGSGLEANKVDTDDNANIEAEFVYGDYSYQPSGATSRPVTTANPVVPATTVTVPSTQVTSSFPGPTPTPTPNPHTHDVSIPQQEIVIPPRTIEVSGQVVVIPTYTLNFNATMLVVIVAPATAWEAGKTFSLDIKGLSGAVYYATACQAGGK